MTVTILAECQGGWMDLWHIILMETSMMLITVIMVQKPKVFNFTLFHLSIKAILHRNQRYSISQYLLENLRKRARGLVKNRVSI